jgi:hypothetical protein
MLNFTIFNAPIWLLTFFTSVSQNCGIKASAITASVTFLTALVDVTKKYIEGEEKPSD